MRTFKKAKEIFNSQLNTYNNEDTIISLKEPRTSLLKFNSTLRLHKLYLYNKIFQRALKKLNLFYFFKTSKNKKGFYKFISQLSEIPNPIRKHRGNKVIAKILKNYYLIRNFNFSFKKQFINNLNYKNEVKTLLIKLKHIIFSNFFEYKISYLLKLRKNFSLYKKEINILLESLKNSKVYINKKRNLEHLIQNLRFSFRKTFINLRWSNKFFTELMQRIQFVVCIYSIALLVLICNGFCCTSNYTNLQQTVRQALTRAQNKINLLTPPERRLKFFLDWIQNIRNYSSLVLIFYISLFLKPKNTIKLPKNTLSHLGVCAITGFIVYGLELSQSLINYVLKFGVLFSDIYFSKIFIRTGKKLLFLRDYTNLLTNEANVRAAYLFKLFKHPKMFESSVEYTVTIPYEYISKRYSRFYYYYLGRYEYLIEKIIRNSDGFLKTYIIFPFYAVLIISLVYNCCYYIIYNKQPYIPIVSDLVKKLTPNNQNE